MSSSGLRKTYTYTSERLPVVDRGEVSFEVNEAHGIKCAFHGFFSVIYCAPILKFRWDEYVEEDMVEIVGQFTFKKVDDQDHESVIFRYDLDMKDGPCTYTPSSVQFPPNTKFDFDVFYEWKLDVVKRPPTIIDYPSRFMKTEYDDTALGIDGAIFWVNKGYLAHQSNYFRCLFSRQYTDADNDVIRIKDITRDEFGMLLSLIYRPYRDPPKDTQIDNMLHLAIVYQLPEVTEIVEKHLKEESKIEPIKIMEIARDYGLLRVISHYAPILSRH